MSNDAAGFASATDRMIASPKGAFDAGLRPDPFPDQAASLLPGLLAATRTGLTPASDDELETRTSPQRDHLLITGRTGCSTNGASPQPDEACGVHLVDVGGLRSGRMTRDGGAGRVYDCPVAVVGRGGRLIPNRSPS